MQSDILGAYAHGIRNILCLSGDHISFGNHPTARDVHDIDSMQLIRMLQQMRDEGKFQCGEDINGGGPGLFIGAAASPACAPARMRPLRLAKKVAAGADFIQTQMIFDMEQFRKYMQTIVDMGLAEKISFLAGVGPLKSPAMARFLNDRVPGLEVPEPYIKRMEDAAEGIDAGDKAALRDAWRAEGIRICIEQIEEIREIEGVAGVHVMAIEWEAAIETIVKGAGLYPRPALASG
jgi:methylenetetrahydrofolate reductase (NADPH)